MKNILVGWILSTLFKPTSTRVPEEVGGLPFRVTPANNDSYVKNPLISVHILINFFSQIKN